MKAYQKEQDEAAKFYARFHFHPDFNSDANQACQHSFNAGVQLLTRVIQANIDGSLNAEKWNAIIRNHPEKI